MTKYLAQNGQLLLPILDLIQNAQTAVDEVIYVVGRSTLEAILLLSARQVAGVQHKGKSTGSIRWHGSQPGVKWRITVELGLDFSHVVAPVAILLRPLQ